MTRTRLHSVASRLALAWVVRLRQIHYLLGRVPLHRAGRLRLRARILTFLLSRYGDDPEIDRFRTGAHRPGRPFFLGLPHAVPGRPLPRVVIRRLLERIARMNRLD